MAIYAIERLCLKPKIKVLIPSFTDIYLSYKLNYCKMTHCGVTLEILSGTPSGTLHKMIRSTIKLDNKFFSEM